MENYYIDLIKENHVNRSLLEGMKFDSISELEKAWVEKKFSEEEVLNTIKSMKSDKFPRPDGFSIAFYQKC